ncbi:unnamed protein product [Phaedon cochleariae]|uniref:DUF7869 domain-containing protein n=1 Tax=Phaedon cochleariae TaxID=80249 RepID=A0A9N9SHU5_PHACE|nr:unnamed protein product [Phaedon cochleariae]
MDNPPKKSRSRRMVDACKSESNQNRGIVVSIAESTQEKKLTSIITKCDLLNSPQPTSSSNLLKKSSETDVMAHFSETTYITSEELEQQHSSREIPNIEFLENIRSSNFLGTISDISSSHLVEKNVVIDDSVLSNQPTNETTSIHNMTGDDGLDSISTEFMEDSDDSIADPDFQEDPEKSKETDNDEDSEESNDESENPPASVEDVGSLQQTEDPVLPRGRKRKALPDTWQRNIRKRSVLGGAEHKYKTKVIKAKQVGQPCNDTCHFKCKEQISEDLRKSIHSKFWNPNQSMDMKRQYVSAMVQLVPVSRIREKTGSRSGRRNFTRQYCFEFNGSKIKVCQKFFLSTLSISQSFVTTALKKKIDGGIVGEDLRGKHAAINKIPENVRQGVRDHIMRFPIIESHYSRERSKKKYLGNDLNLTRMYELYKAECHGCNTPEELIAKNWLYIEIFQTEFNLSFKLPYNDTCDECDKLLLCKGQATEPAERDELQQRYSEHINEASNRYSLKKQDKELAQRSNEKIMITVDLQKCLPTPVLTNAQSFYTLKLWTYNYTINEASRNMTTCIMWDESKSGRGGNEMASGMLKWAMGIDKSVSEITIWSDNCPSQNRNIIMVMAYFWITNRNSNVKIINHKFLLRGHTHLEVDGDHSLIERERKKTQFLQIMTPWDWQQIARLCSRSKPFNVVNMELGDFKDFKTLYTSNTSPFIYRKKTMTGTDFQISKVVHLQVRSEEMGKLFYKTNFESNDFDCVDLNRTGRRIMIPDNLPPLRQQSNCISTKKYKHLQTLLPWIPSQFHSFYKELSHSDKVDDDI